MKKRILLTTSVALLLTGCITPSLQSNLDSSQGAKALIFSTNEATFITKLNQNSSKEERNEFIEEFILKSDVQCQQFLDNPPENTQESESESELYLNIAQTVSTVLGLGYITQTAQSIFLDNDSSKDESKKAYANALSPEIKKGVEIVRERYANKIKNKKKLPVKKYNTNQLKEDMSIYDKQCNKEYGLIEINRALKEMRSQLRTTQYPQAKNSPKINLQSVAKKVENVTKEVKKKEEEKKIKKQIEEKKQTETKKVAPSNAPITAPISAPTKTL